MPCPSWDTSGWRGSKETREAGSIRNGLTITNIYVPLYSEQGIFIYICDLIEKNWPQSFLRSIGLSEADADKRWHDYQERGVGEPRVEVQL